MTHEIFAETLSAVNVRNGVVRLILVDQAANDLAITEREEGQEPVVETKAVVTMPIGGFLYMASIIQNLLADEKFGNTVRAMVEAGLVNAEINEQADLQSEA
ncbi:hypothetical protein FHS89_003158 [Rubricella aquisinus]|uniref:Uncharacterized protein n=1 Tax=Rubricella aquisinus TaxID=2028108 RepID=A0A840WTV5_9RHOB|nr:hypothetical protein [Rubricella aquisinus]MBB5517112.1 hypothetical protein [Rubricella aquisinus]